jgi:hypothetical protein
MWIGIGLYVAIMIFGSIWVAIRYFSERRDQKKHRETRDHLERSNGQQRRGSGLKTP